MPRKSFLLRLPEELLDELRGWAAQEMRSVNGQMEFVLRRALREAGRVPRSARGDSDARGSGPESSDGEPERSETDS